MRRGRPGDPYKTALAALKADVAGWQRQIAATEALIADLTVRAEGGTRGAVQGPVHDVPLVKRKRRRRRAHARRAANAKPAQAIRKPVRKRAVVNATPDASKPVAVSAKVVRGATAFATELKAIDEIVATLAKAETALNRATRAKDNVAIAAASEEIHQLRRRGNELLVRLGGKARLPIDKAERMRWRRAGTIASAPKPKRAKAPRKPAVPIPPVLKQTGPWVEEPNGVRSREVVST
jgi:hypothetical protein